MDYVINSLNKNLPKDDANNITIILYGRVMKLASKLVVANTTEYRIAWKDNIIVYKILIL